MPSKTTPPLPSVHEWQAPATWRAIEFISDLHLSAETPRTFDALAHYLGSTDADAVVILGDLFESWPGDDASTDAPHVESRCVALLKRLSARFSVLAFMVGNRDFLFGADALQAAGMTGLHDPTVVRAFGQSALLTHGDALCLADTEYLRFRAMVRDPAWQQQVLSRPLVVRRQLASQMRAQSETKSGGASPDPMDWADVDADTAVQWLRAAASVTMVHGHTHRPRSEPLAPGYTRHVLTDWDLDHTAHRAEVLRWTAAGFERRPVPPAPAP